MTSSQSPQGARDAGFDAARALRLAHETFDIEAAALTGLAARVDGVFAQAVHMVLQARGRVGVGGMGGAGAGGAAQSGSPSQQALLLRSTAWVPGAPDTTTTGTCSA